MWFITAANYAVQSSPCQSDEWSNTSQRNQYHSYSLDGSTLLETGQRDSPVCSRTQRLSRQKRRDLCQIDLVDGILPKELSIL